MEYQASSPQCQCTNCPGAGCNCGCQSATEAIGGQPKPPYCACAVPCGCDAAEQGCLCG